MSSSADTLSVCTANIAFAPGAAALAQPKAATRLKKKKKNSEVIHLSSSADVWKSFNSISHKDRSEISECGNLLFLASAQSRCFLKRYL